MGFGKFLGFVIGGAVAVVCAPVIGAVASVVGLGAAAGTLTGAAASSAGLAALGGGSLAAGGFGMAGGTAVVGVAGAAAGKVVAAATGHGPAGGTGFIDNCIRDMVSEPAVGSMVYCDLLPFEHTGIYVGNGKIVHLDGDGSIYECSPSTFLERLDGYNIAISIYTACRDKYPVGDLGCARRALSMVGKRRDYNLFLDNCHQFTAGCLTGNFENAYNAFTFLRSLAENVLGANTWRVWKI